MRRHTIAENRNQNSIKIRPLDPYIGSTVADNIHGYLNLENKVQPSRTVTLSKLEWMGKGAVVKEGRHEEGPCVKAIYILTRYQPAKCLWIILTDGECINPPLSQDSRRLYS